MPFSSFSRSGHRLLAAGFIQTVYDGDVGSKVTAVEQIDPESFHEILLLIPQGGHGQNPGRFLHHQKITIFVNNAESAAPVSLALFITLMRIIPDQNLGTGSHPSTGIPAGRAIEEDAAVFEEAANIRPGKIRKALNHPIDSPGLWEAYLVMNFL